MAGEKDLEATSSQPQHIPHFRQVRDMAGITEDVLNWHYKGSGTEEDPYVVNWITNDPRNPQNYTSSKKWSITLVVAIATLAVAFDSSAYSGAASGIVPEFGISQIVFILGVSLFVVGFAIGPLLWAPLSELFGRQVLYLITLGALSAFLAGTAGAQNIETLLILRFLAGAFGSSPLTNAGGVIADMFNAKERGLAMALFAAAPFMGPVLGPIVGGFVGMTVGWRWVMGVMAIFTGVMWIVGVIYVPETYPPVLLKARAKKLSKITGKVYKSQAEIDQGPTSFGHLFRTSLLRPWVLLFREPIVLLLSVYMAIVYGTLYMLFAAFPIVFQQGRGWSPGIGGLAFLGVAVGMVGAIAFSVYDNERYKKISDEYKGFAPPEARLPVTIIGGVCLPVGLFWFAWTNSPSIHWMVPIAAGVPFGFGMVLVFLGIMTYLIDTYTIFAASVLAANAVLRSLFGAAFPLFTSDMYANLGIHWASSIPAFLALACVPFPFLFWKYGKAIRLRCKFAAQSEAFMRRIQAQMTQSGDESEKSSESEKPGKDEDTSTMTTSSREEREEFREAAEEPSDYPLSPATSSEQRHHSIAGTTKLEPIRTGGGGPILRRVETGYEGNPFDLDRVNTRESFKGSRSRASSTSSRKSSRR